VYERKIRHIDDPQKRLLQTWFDFEQNLLLTSMVRPSEIVCVLVADTLKLNTCCEIIVHLYYVVQQNIM